MKSIGDVTLMIEQSKKVREYYDDRIDNAESEEDREFWERQAVTESAVIRAFEWVLS